jgi:hypothetical protein
MKKKIVKLKLSMSGDGGIIYTDACIEKIKKSIDKHVNTYHPNARVYVKDKLNDFNNPLPALCIMSDNMMGRVILREDDILHIELDSDFVETGILTEDSVVVPVGGWKLNEYKKIVGNKLLVEEQDFSLMFLVLMEQE